MLYVCAFCSKSPLLTFSHNVYLFKDQVSNEAIRGGNISVIKKSEQQVEPANVAWAFARSTYLVHLSYVKCWYVLGANMGALVVYNGYCTRPPPAAIIF